MNNYDYSAQWAEREAGRNGCVLDYGCGAGHVIALLRSRGVNARGCDVFFEGGEYSANLVPAAKPFIVRMEGDRIPFDDASFDVVISNQVIEHVPDLNVAAGEIARVLKPGGASLHLFPDRGVWTEPHSNVPFLHRFRKGAGWRLYHVALMRALRYGRRASPLLETSRRRIEWVDRWTYFRSAREISACFARYFPHIEHIEDSLFDARVGIAGVPRALKRWLVRKLAGSVLLLRLRE